MPRVSRGDFAKSVDTHASRLRLDNLSFVIRYGSTSYVFLYESQAFLWNLVVHQGKSDKDACEEHCQWSGKYGNWLSQPIVAAVIKCIRGWMEQAPAGSDQAAHWKSVTQYLNDPYSLAPPPDRRADTSRTKPINRYVQGQDLSGASLFEFTHGNFDLKYNGGYPWIFNPQQQAYLWNVVIHRGLSLNEAAEHHFKWAGRYRKLVWYVVKDLLDRIQYGLANAPLDSPEAAHWKYVTQYIEDLNTLTRPDDSKSQNVMYTSAQPAQANLQPLYPSDPNSATLQQQQAGPSLPSAFLNPGDYGYPDQQQQTLPSVTSPYVNTGGYIHSGPYPQEQNLPMGFVESEELEEWEPAPPPRRQRHPPRSERSEESEQNRSLVLRTGQSRQQSLRPETGFDDLSDEDENAVLHSLKNQISTIYNDAVESVRIKDIADREPLREAIARATRQAWHLQDQARREIETRKRKRSESERRTGDSGRSSLSNWSRQERERTRPPSPEPGSLDGLEQEEQDTYKREAQALWQQGMQKSGVQGLMEGDQRDYMGEARQKVKELRAKYKAVSQRRLEERRHVQESARERERSSRQERPSREGDRRRTTEGGRRPERSGKEREPPRDSHQKKKPRDSRR